MSNLVDDKSPISEGRKNVLSGVEAPLRDQIVAKLFKKLEDQDIALKVTNTWEEGLAHRSLWSERQQAWMSSWDEHLTADTDGHFEGSSQLHIPMPFIVCKTMHARFLQAIWQDPPFNVKAQNEASTDSIALVRDVLRYYLIRGANHNKGIGKVVDGWVWDWITQGSGVMKARWDIQYSSFIDVRPVKKPGPPVFAVVDGKETAQQTFVDAEEEFVNQKKCFDGPIFDLVDLEDLLIVGGKGDPEEADSCIQREYLTASQLWTLADRKIFKAEAVKEIIEGGPDRESGATGTDIKQDRARNAGKASLDNEQDLDRYEILEAYLRVDVDGSGINSDVIVWVHKKSKTLLRATYLYRVSKRGMRPFFKADFHPRKGQEYGVGMVELLYPLSKEMDAIHNMRIDFGLVSVMPFGFYKPTSGIDPETIQLEPGALIPVDNPQTDVYFPNLGNRTVFGMQEEAAIQSMVERLTSISDLNLGLTSSQGATRTATGARAVMSEMSSNLDVYLRRLNWGWERALIYLLDTLQQRVPKGLTFRLTGDSGAEIFRTINSAKDIEGDFDVEVSPNSSSSNPQMQQEVAQQIFGLVANPLAIQLGAVTPANFYAALENQMRALGVRDFSKYITKPQGPLRVFTPEEEANRILRGMPVPITPEMDHEGFIAFWEHFKESDELLGQINEEGTIAMEKQSQGHAQMAQALQAQQAQQANANQMRQNSSMSQQQAPMTAPAGAAGAAGGPQGVPQ